MEEVRRISMCEGYDKIMGAFYEYRSTKEGKRMHALLELLNHMAIDFCELHALLCFDKCQYKCLMVKNCSNCGKTYCKDCLIEKHGCAFNNKKTAKLLKIPTKIINKLPNNIPKYLTTTGKEIIPAPKIVLLI